MSRAIAAIILAAGKSSRLGEPKQLVRIGRETLLERAIRIADEADCKPILVVLGAERERIIESTKLDCAIVVPNADWPEGMASSIRAGVAALSGDTTGAILSVCDQPAITAGHLRALMKEPKQMMASRYMGRNGVPAYFPAEDFAQLEKLQGDNGARELLRDAAAIELPGGELDIDTPDDLRQMKQLPE